MASEDISAGDFHSPFTHGFVRVAVAVPRVRVADPGFNADRTVALAERAAGRGASIALFPELGLSAYSCDDLFHQDALLEGVRDALASVAAGCAASGILALVGAPLRVDGRLFNAAVVLHRGRVLGVIPKTFLPNYREFYERRQFCAARHAVADAIDLLGERVPFGNDLVFVAENVEGLAVHAELCEDVWAPVPPSTFAALGGATVLANLSASNITIGKDEYRRRLCAMQSAKCLAAYLYSAAGHGESTTDLAWDGHALIHENGDLLAESERFSDDEQLVVADVDLERLVQERMRLTSFHDAAAEHADRVRVLRRVVFRASTASGAAAAAFERTVARFPYVPADERLRDERCGEAYRIQVHGLVKRLESCGLRRVVVGISGGLDSTQALLVAVRAMDRLGWPRTNVLAFTMPGFATSDATLANARRLMEALGVTARELDIRPSCDQMLRDIDHPAARGEPVYDTTYENVQAGERTSHLFRLANRHEGIVLGTGDLSELALGWCTYGVGDHMSHYNVNASVPKTLIRHLIAWVAETGEAGEAAGPVLREILATEISPELVPDTGEGIQRTEDAIGPYELQDFNLYHVTRFGFRPSKVAFLASRAWEGEYDLPTITRWLRVFLHRFFQTSQFKRTCVPNSPKVGSGGSLSPRGDWRAPSDSEAAAWLGELDENVPGR